MYADAKKAMSDEGQALEKPLFTAIDNGTETTDDTLAPEEPSTEEAGGQ